MADALRKEDAELVQRADSLSLEGLEPLLEGNFEIEAQEALHQTYERTYQGTYQEVLPAQAPSSGNDTRLILDLLGQLEAVNELVLETGYQMERMREKVNELSSHLIGEEKLLAQITKLENENQRIVELETWLDALIAENERLKRPVWKKIIGLK